MCWQTKELPRQRHTTKAIYTTVFGLSASPFNGYVMLTAADRTPIAGIEQVDDASATDGFFRPTFDSDDLEADLAAVEEAGGSTAVPRQLISPEYGWWAAALDPFGNRIQVSTSTPASRQSDVLWSTMRPCC